MKKNNGWFSSDRMDRIVVALSLIGILLCLPILVSEDVYNRIFGKHSSSSQGAVIGEISFAKNDIRHKGPDAIAWEHAASEQRIRLGDSVFTGANSQSQVALASGGRVDLDQNSLVVFRKIDDLEIPNLALGNFRVSVNGHMNIAIAGQVTEIDGDGSEVQVTLSAKKKPTVRLLKGKAQVKVQGQTKRLEQNAVVVLPAKSPEPTPTPMPVVVANIPEPTVAANDVASSFVYTNELYDIFDNHDGKLSLRERPRSIVTLTVPITWSIQGSPSEVFGQLSSVTDFSNIHDSFNAKATDLKAEFKHVVLGLNQFRISVDGTKWSKPGQFTVEAQNLDIKKPAIQMHAKKFFILGDDVEVTVPIIADEKLTSLTLEASETPEFASNLTHVVWTKERLFRFRVADPKTIFLRVRGLNSNFKITEPSDVIRIVIEKPSEPQAPRLVKSEIHVYQGDDVAFAWTTAQNARLYHVQVMNSQGQKVFEKDLSREVLKLKANQVGEFVAKVAGVDAFGRHSQVTKGRIIVSPRPAPLLAVSKPPERKPAEESASLNEKITIDHPENLNTDYNKSLFSLEGAAFSMFSQNQVAQGYSNPTALMGALRWLTWNGSNGFEGDFETKIADIDVSPNAQVAPLQIEASYLHRWTLPFNPFSNLGNSQIAWIAGLEYYRNADGAPFSPGYNLIKTGFSLAFPVWRRFDTGGEVLYGYGFDQSQKYEVSGYFDYFLVRNWSLGVGYRVYLFQAGSNASTPYGLPYREGYGEGYSVLKWHY